MEYDLSVRLPGVGDGPLHLLGDHDQPLHRVFIDAHTTCPSARATKKARQIQFLHLGGRHMVHVSGPHDLDDCIAVGFRRSLLDHDGTICHRGPTTEVPKTRLNRLEYTGASRRLLHATA